MLIGKLAKRGIDVRFLDETKAPEKIGGDCLKQTIVVKEGVTKELGKTIQGIIKNAKALKLTAAIQGDIVRVSGAKRDALQEAIALLKTEVKEVPLNFKNKEDARSGVLFVLQLWKGLRCRALQSSRRPSTRSPRT